MKTLLLCPVLAWTLHAQAPAADPASFTPDTVVAKIDGKPLTAGEIQRILDAGSPVFLQSFQRNPIEALQAVFVLRHLAEEAEKLKLDQEPKWKDQIDAAKEQVLATAMVTRERNTFNFTPDDVDNYYQKNKNRFEQVRIKLIKIGFKPGAQPSGTSIEDLERAAKEALLAAHSAATRPEADAKKIADDLVKRARAGADFSKLVADFSEDQETKASGGDVGFIKPSGAYPEDLKKAAFALKVGDVSEPVRIQVGFYVLRAEERTATPFNEVRDMIVDEMRQARVGALVSDLQRRFLPTIEKPEVLRRFTPGKP